MDKRQEELMQVIRASAGDNDWRNCALSRLADRKGSRSRLSDTAVEHIPGATQAWAAGVMDGWDGVLGSPHYSMWAGWLFDHSDVNHADYVAGLAAGQAARMELAP